MVFAHAALHQRAARLLEALAAIEGGAALRLHHAHVGHTLRLHATLALEHAVAPEVRARAALHDLLAAFAAIRAACATAPPVPSKALSPWDADRHLEALDAIEAVADSRLHDAHVATADVIVHNPRAPEGFADIVRHNLHLHEAIAAIEVVDASGHRVVLGAVVAALARAALAAEGLPEPAERPHSTMALGLAPRRPASAVAAVIVSRAWISTTPPTRWRP